jgi:hypothetical protein
MPTNRQRSADADRLVARYEPQTQALIAAARATLLAAFPKAEESVDLQARLLGYAYGPGYKGTVATLILSKTGVKIGIPYGAALSDPEGLLTGAGRVHRHIAITHAAQLRAPATKAVLKAALTAWRTRMGGS